MADIILDEAAFRKASAKLKDASDGLAQLVTDMEDSVTELERGFDTPAGRSFARLYRERVIRQTSEQGDTLRQISEDLELAKNSYQSVFDEYRKLLSLSQGTR